MRCFVCNNNEWTDFYSNLEKCNFCYFVKAKNGFFKKDHKRVYKKSYFFSGEYLDYEKEGLALEKNFQERLRDLLKYKESGRLLDIGSAYGFFLKAAKTFYKVEGIDLDPSVTKKGEAISGTKIHSGEFLKKRFSTNTYDAVCMFDTIEHLKNPKRYLKKIHSLLKPKGLLAIETGDLDSLVARFRKERWRLIDPRVHLTYFSKNTLTKFLQLNGFEILEIKRVSTRRTLAQIIYRILGKKRFSSFMYKFFLKLNLGDIIFVISQKK